MDKPERSPNIFVGEAFAVKFALKQLGGL